MKIRLHAWRAILTAAAGAFALSACEGERTTRNPDNPSGYAVPRYLVLKYDRVNGRSGPSEDHPIKSEYKALGLPVQVIAETKDWRRICDPLGDVTWVASRMLDGQRAVVRMKPGALPVIRSPKAGASQVAVLPERGRAELVRCDGDWCRVRIGETQGWVPVREVWGADPKAQCAGLPAPTPQEVEAITGRAAKAG